MPTTLSCLEKVLTCQTDPTSSLQIQHHIISTLSMLHHLHLLICHVSLLCLLHHQHPGPCLVVFCPVAERLLMVTISALCLGQLFPALASAATQAQIFSTSSADGVLVHSHFVLEIKCVLMFPTLDLLGFVCASLILIPSRPPCYIRPSVFSGT